MNLKNTVTGYGVIAILLHWLMALLIAGLFAVGWWMTELSYYDPWYQKAPWWHKSVGVLLLALWMVRLLWRVTNTRPSPVKEHKPWELRMARWVHSFLYGLILAVIISGYMISTADGRPLSVFGWFDIPAWRTGIDNQEDIAGLFHFYLACALICLAVVHALAAIKHHVIDKDSTLRRMVKFRFSANGG